MSRPFINISLDKQKFGSEEEEVSSTVFSPAQITGIKNLMVEVATERANLAFTPAQPELFGQQTEYLRGQLQILAFLIATSEETIVNLTAQSNE